MRDEETRPPQLVPCVRDSPHLVAGESACFSRLRQLLYAANKEKDDAEGKNGKTLIAN